MRRTRRHRRHAYSLSEVLIASALVGAVLVTALETVGGAARTWRAASGEFDGLTLAHDLMTEVLAQSYGDPDTTNDPDYEDFGVEPGERADDRSTWDDLDDYNDWSASPPQSRDGAAIAGYTGWTRKVTVQKLKSRKIDDFHNNDDKDRGGRLVTVRVVGPSGETTELQAFRGALGGLEQSFGVDAEVVSHLGVTIDAGGAGPIVTGTRVLNHAEGP